MSTLKFAHLDFAMRIVRDPEQEIAEEPPVAQTESGRAVSAAAAMPNESAGSKEKQTRPV